MNHFTEHQEFLGYMANKCKAATTKANKRKAPMEATEDEYKFTDEDNT